MSPKSVYQCPKRPVSTPAITITQKSSITNWVHNTEGKLGKSGKNLEDWKNHGKPGKRREISWKIIALRENSGKMFKLLFNFMIQHHCVFHNLVIIL